MKLASILEDYETPRTLENYITVPPESERMRAMDIIDEIEGKLISKQMPPRNPGSSSMEWATQYGQLAHKIRRQLGKVGTIPIAKLKALETHLDEEHVRRLLQGEKGKSIEELPVVYWLNSGAYIGDGNHRVAAEHARGNDKVKVLLLDFRQHEKELQS